MIKRCIANRKVSLFCGLPTCTLAILQLSSCIAYNMMRAVCFRHDINMPACRVSMHQYSSSSHIDQSCLLAGVALQMVCSHVMRRPCWWTKQQQIMARILHNNRVKFPKDFFSIVLSTNMAAMTSSENHLLQPPFLPLFLSLSFRFPCVFFSIVLHFYFIILFLLFQCKLHEYY